MSMDTASILINWRCGESSDPGERIPIALGIDETLWDEPSLNRCEDFRQNDRGKQFRPCTASHFFPRGPYHLFAFGPFSLLVSFCSFSARLNPNDDVQYKVRNPNKTSGEPYETGSLEKGQAVRRRFDASIVFLWSYLWNGASVGLEICFSA